MIKLHDDEGFAVLVNPDEISTVASVDSWRMRYSSIVKMRNGDRFNVREDGGSVKRMIEAQAGSVNDGS